MSDLAAESRRILVIYNPTAGWRRHRRFGRVLKHLEQLGCAVTVRETGARGDAEAFAREADPEAFDIVAVAGGDGTINEVINGLEHSSLALALIPLGTANVLAAEIGLATSPRIVAETIATCRPHPAYVGSANGRRFAMMVGIGIDARVVERIDIRLKRTAGKLAYVASALSAIARYRRTTYQVEIDGKRHDAAFAVIAKGHFYGGRFVVAPLARLDEPSLQVALFARSGRWNLLRYAAALLLDRMDKLPDVTVLPAKSVRVFGPLGEAVQADGDLAASLPLSVILSEQPLSLISVPV